jgi:hypothetical protein
LDIDVKAPLFHAVVESGVFHVVLDGLTDLGSGCFLHPRPNAKHLKG